jgi:hypothetical protein
MEENTQIEEGLPGVSLQLEGEISQKVSTLKKEDPKLKKIFPIIVFGSGDDEKEQYIGYFRQPSFASFSKYLTASQSNPAVAMRTLAKECFIDGDKELVDDDSLFLFGLLGQLSKVIETRNGQLVNLSKPGK